LIHGQVLAKQVGCEISKSFLCCCCCSPFRFVYYRAVFVKLLN
jgi:hypothetical protein